MTIHDNIFSFTNAGESISGITWQTGTSEATLSVTTAGFSTTAAVVR